MILTREDIIRILERHLSDEPVKGYAIRINGRTFTTDKGKILWKKRHYAISAFRKTLEYLVLNYVFSKLMEQGLSTTEIYRSEEYGNAWDNFMKYLKDNNLIQIIEVEW